MIGSKFHILLGVSLAAWASSLSGQSPEATALLAHATWTNPVAYGKLRGGSVMEGTLERPVFAGRSEFLAAGTRVRLVVDGVKKEPRPSPGLPRRLASLATGAPGPKPSYAITLRSASVTRPDGRAVEAQVEVAAVLRQRKLRSKDREGTDKADSKAVSTIVLRIAHAPEAAAPVQISATTGIPAGTRARVMLMRGLNASGSNPNEQAEARLLEPVRLADGTVIPAGSLFEGHVTSLQRPRRLFRPAKMRLSFNRLQVSPGRSAQVSTMLTGADVRQGAGAEMDAEGGISGGPASKKRMLIDLGVAYATGKVLDDLLEEGVKWGVGAASAGTAATVARYVGIGTGAVFLALQRGRDVGLPQYTELELTFTRPVTLEAARPPAAR